MHSPLVLTGRGGSGTRMLSEIARHFDVFLGNEINKTGDSTEWADLIYDYAISKFEKGDRVGLLKRRKFSRQIAGMSKKLAADGLAGNHRHWGWKLPETILVIPEIHARFPDMKLVHLVRHPVSISLRGVHLTSRISHRVGRRVVAAAYRRYGRPVERMKTDEIHLHNAYSWKYQVASAMEYGRNELPAGNYIELKFEDLCSRPEAEEARIGEFIGEAPRIDSETIAINPRPRKPEFWSRDKIEEVWEVCADVATELGYTLDDIAELIPAETDPGTDGKPD